jgi:hypothetical protein
MVLITSKTFETLFRFFEVAKGTDTSIGVIKEYAIFFGITEAEMVEILSNPEWKIPEGFNGSVIEDVPGVQNEWKTKNPQGYSYLIHKFIETNIHCANICIHGQGYSGCNKYPTPKGNTGCLNVDPGIRHTDMPYLLTFTKYWDENDEDEEEEHTRYFYRTNFQGIAYSVINDILKSVFGTENLAVIGGAVLKDYPMESYFLKTLNLDQNTMKGYTDKCGEILDQKTQNAKSLCDNIIYSIIVSVRSKSGKTEKYPCIDPTVTSQLMAEIKKYPYVWNYIHTEMIKRLKTDGIDKILMAIFFQQSGFDVTYIEFIPVLAHFDGYNNNTDIGYTKIFDNLTYEQGIHNLLTCLLNEKPYSNPSRYLVNSLIVENLFCIFVKNLLRGSLFIIDWFIEQFSGRMNQERLIDSIIRTVTDYLSDSTNSDCYADPTLSRLKTHFPSIVSRQEFTILWDEFHDKRNDTFLNNQ